MRKEIRQEIREILKPYNMNFMKIKNHYYLLNDNICYYNTYCNTLATLYMYVRDNDLSKIKQSM